MTVDYFSSRTQQPFGHAGPRANVFRSPPPGSTPSSPQVGYTSINELDSTILNSNGKRPRLGQSALSFSTSVTSFSDTEGPWKTEFESPGSILADSTTPSLINTKYRLAGGLDTPAQGALSPLDSIGATSDAGFRKNWGASAVNQMAVNNNIVNPLGREQNGRARAYGHAATQTWSQFLFSAVGGVAGRMWDFCRTSAFSGFVAGGGMSYGMASNTTRPLPVRAATDSIFELVGHHATPLPGRFPVDDEFLESTHGEDVQQERPAKRLHTATSSGSDWVMVRHNDACASTPTSPLTRPAGASRPRMHSFSRAQVPRPSAPRTCSSHSRRPSTARTSATTATGSPGIANGMRRSASFASTRSPPASPPPLKHSPASADIQRYASKRNREEKQTDARLKSLNKQLQAMIREGRAALGSTIEVDLDNDGFDETDFGGKLGSDEVVDEGFAEMEDENDHRMSW